MKDESQIAPPPRQVRRQTWILRACRRGSGARFEDVHVLAASALQAEAMLRRQGFEVDDAATRMGDESQYDRRVLWTPSGTLVCGRCGYDLDGLLVRHAAIECPECGFAQVVLAYSPNAGLTREEQAAGMGSQTRTTWFAMGCLTSVMILLTLVLLLFALAPWL